MTVLIRRAGMAAAAATLALTISACSKIDTPSTGGAPAGGGSAATAGATPTIAYDGPEAALKNAFPAPPAPSKKLTIGLSNLNLKIPALAQMQAGVADEVTKIGGTLVAKDSQLDLNTQVNQMQELIDRKVDAIVVYPLDPNALAPQLKAAAAAGIPVVAINTPIKAGDPLLPGYVANVLQGFDRAAYSRAAAIAAVAPGSSYAVLGLTIPVGTLKYYSERQRYWADRFGLKFLGEQDAQTDDPTGGGQAMTAILGKYPDVTTVFTYNDPSALGAAGAARSAGKTVRVFGSDGSDQATFDAVKAGQLFATYRVDQYSEGAQATVAAITAAAKGSLPFSTVVVTGKVVTADNAATVSPTGPLAGP